MTSWFKALCTVLSLFVGAASAGPLLWVGDGDGTLGYVDVATGNATVVGEMGTTMTDIAFDPSGNLWGITFDQLYRIDHTTGVITLVGSLGASLNSLVFGADGTLYGANNALYSINTVTAAATMIGGGSYSSSGDLAFVNGNLFLSSASADFLYQLDILTGAGTLLGNIGFSAVYGLATPDNTTLYGISGTNVLGIDTLSGLGTFVVDYAGTQLGAAWGSAFLGESGHEVPVPATLALLAFGVLMLRRRTR